MKEQEQATHQRVLVMGVGNTLLLDEGVGPRVIEQLIDEYEFPENVDVVDSGTMGMSILHLFEEYDYMLVVDAIDDPTLEPGSVVSFSPEEIAPNAVMHSLHDMRFVDVLQNAELLGWTPEGQCVGIQVKDMQPAELTEGLTPEVQAAVPVAIDAVITLLSEIGIEAKKK